MGKLYQMLVLEPEKKNQAAKMVAETAKVFKGGDLFYGRVKKYIPDNEGGEPLPEERKEMVTTVSDRLKWTWNSLSDLFDFMATKDAANQLAKADVVIAGKTLTLPATFILAMEKKLKEIRSIYDAIPTLDLSTQWRQDEHNKNKHINGPQISYRTAKLTKGIILAQATDKHQALVEKVVEDKTIGHYETTEWSGALHPEEKAKLLAKIDTLIDTFKSARMVANQVEAAKIEVGKAIFEQIHGG